MKDKRYFSFTILTILCFFFYLDAFCQKCTYFQYIYKAQIESFNNNSERSVIYYDSAFTISSPIPLDIERALKESSKRKDFEKCASYLNALLNAGIDVTEEINSMEYSEDYKATNYYKIFIKDYNTTLKKKQEGFDTTLIIQLKAMAIADQEYRRMSYAKGDTSYYKAMRESDVNNFLLLKSIVEAKGWPSYKKVGYPYTGIANIVLLHGSRYFSLESKEWLFFENILKEEILNGRFYPITLAQWIDQHRLLIEKKNQKYGSVANVDGELFPIDNIDCIDSIRAEICLEPLKDFMTKKCYTKILVK